MRNIYLKWIFLGLGLLLFVQCTKVAEEENNHPAEWATAGSENFHGDKVRASGVEACASCHGESKNDSKVGISCFDCHEGGPSGHPAKNIWLNKDSNDFHGASVADNGTTDCSVCHGSDYLGGFSEQSCFVCHEGGPSGHPASGEWLSSDSTEFHGALVAENGPTECSTCHGDDYTGGVAEKSCFTCHEGGPSGHPASSEWRSPSSEYYHGKVLWDNGWDFTSCQTCHGSDLKGGTAEKSCGSCHTDNENVPFGCTTCHGDKVTGKFSPPESIKGETSTSNLSVGAHTAHLEGGTYSDVIECNQCHIVPASWDATDHLGADNRAEITFGDLASAGGAEPVYNKESGTCSNVYCHGNFNINGITGTNTDMNWTTSTVTCGSCHAIAPAGHSGSWDSASQCFTCHAGVMNSDGTFKNKSKHINGDKDF